MFVDVNNGDYVFDLFAEGIGDDFLNIFLLEVPFDVISVQFHDEQTIAFEDIDWSEMFVL